jgi:hypothetical protein
MTHTIADAKKNGRPIEQFVAMAFRIDPSLWDMALKAQALSAQFAQKWLTKHMCKGDAKLAGQITSKLMDVKKYLSHGRIIGVTEAKEILPKGSIMELGKEDPLWNMFWELYVRCEWRINTRRTVKFFANERANMDIGAAVSVQRPPSVPAQLPPLMPLPASMPPPSESPSPSSTEPR